MTYTGTHAARAPHGDAIPPGPEETGDPRSQRLNPYRVIALPQPRQQNSAVTSRLRADYGSLPEWAAGPSVYEIAPLGPSKWVATLGMAQAVKYTAEINPDSSSCLYDTSGVKLRCSGAATTGTVAGVNVAGLSNGDLADLAEAVAAEMSKRLPR